MNAFLTLDVDIPLDVKDAASQSVEFALASNAVIFAIPKIGDNLGVGIEVGSTFEAIYRERTGGGRSVAGVSHHERVSFIHESCVRSGMIASVRDRWNARVNSYTDRNDLVRRVRLFLRDIARRERRGDLPTLDTTPS